MTNSLENSSTSGDIDSRDQQSELRALVSASQKIGLDGTLLLAGSENTQKAYNTDWNRFDAWCRTYGASAMPASGHLVAAYLVHHSTLLSETGTYYYAAGTLNRWVAAINYMHRIHGQVAPGVTMEVRGTLAQIRRARPRPQRVTTPLAAETVARAVKAINLRDFPGGMGGHRDAAILLIGYAGALGPGDIVSRTIGDVTLRHGDMRLAVPATKRNPEAAPAILHLPRGTEPITCPSCALLRWLRVIDAYRAADRDHLQHVIRSGSTSSHICGDAADEIHRFAPDMPLFQAVFRWGHVSPVRVSPSSIKHVIRKRLQAAGIDTTSISGNSLRAGFITQALIAGISSHDIAHHSQHSSVLSVEQYRGRVENTDWTLEVMP